MTVGTQKLPSGSRRVDWPSRVAYGRLRQAESIGHGGTVVSRRPLLILKQPLLIGMKIVFAALHKCAILLIYRTKRSTRSARTAAWWRRLRPRPLVDCKPRRQCAQ